MNLIAIDIGNTSIKAGVFENNQLQNVFKFEDSEGLNLWVDNLPREIYIIISSVTNFEVSTYYSKFNNLYVLSHQTSLPILNRYLTPHTLGNDRLAAVTGANGLFPDKNCLVIDVGTAIKYDLITSKGEYFGGSISPGLDLRFKALHQFTDKLPLIEKQINYEISGNSTDSAIISGVMFGILKEMQGFIDEYSTIYGDLNVIMTGGDYNFFSDRLKGAIFAEPNLVFIGLSEILKYNVSKL